MSGLDSIKHFDEGGTTGDVTAPEGAIQTTAPKATGIAGKIALDPTQTETILANMQQYIDERQSPMNLLRSILLVTFPPSQLLTGLR